MVCGNGRDRVTGTLRSGCYLGRELNPAAVDSSGDNCCESTAPSNTAAVADLLLTCVSAATVSQAESSGLTVQCSMELHPDCCWPALRSFEGLAVEL